MSKLTCQVTSCSNNQKCLCNLTKIKVEGPGARAMDQTCCSSFEEKRNSTQNSKGCSTPCCDTSIDCMADSCTYNKSHKCVANDVNVGCCSSSPCVMSETECCTFSCK